MIYIPGLAENLLSLEALHMAGFETRGSKDGYKILWKGQVKATGKRIGKLTYLETVSSQDALFTGLSYKSLEQNARMAMVTEDNEDRKRTSIHRCLGHLGRARFNRCVHILGLNELKTKKTDCLLQDKCEISIEAKQVKLQNRKRIPRAKAPLQRVYMDFWGPNREGSGPEIYYLSLVDDYSRFSCIKMTEDHKGDTVLSILQSWLKKVERQAGKMLLVIRTDNAKKFVALGPWTESLGIELEFIEAETPAQNGVAERLNRLLLENGRALLLDAAISKKYWKYALMTANYLRNRTITVKGSGFDDEDNSDQRENV